MVGRSILGHLSCPGRKNRNSSFWKIISVGMEFLGVEKFEMGKGMGFIN
jgi:hypothetical protein